MLYNTEASHQGKKNTGNAQEQKCPIKPKDNRKYFKKSDQFWDKILWTGKPRLPCTRMMRKEKYREGEKQLIIQSIPHHQSNMVEAVL